LARIVLWLEFFIFVLLSLDNVKKKPPETDIELKKILLTARGRAVSVYGEGTKDHAPEFWNHLKMSPSCC